MEKHCLSRAELYGESLFTTLRTYGFHVPGWDLHMERLLSSVNEYFFNSAYSLEELSDFFKLSQVKAHLKNNMVYRFTILAKNTASQHFDWDNFELSDLELKIIEKEYDESSITSSLKVKIVPSLWTRNAAQNGKCGQYMSIIKELKKARREGHDDILFAYSDSEISELSTSHCLFEDRGHFIIPTGAYLRFGVTVQLWKKFCHHMNLTYEEKAVHIHDLAEYQHAYALNSVKGGRGISSIKGLTDINYLVNDERISQFLDFYNVVD